MLDVDEWAPTANNAIDVYDQRLRPMPAGEAPINAKSWAEALPPWRISTIAYAEIHELQVRYWMAAWILYEFGSGDTEELRSETRERRKWVNRVSELRPGAKLSIGRSFLLFLLFSSLLHTLLLLWISAQYKWRRHGFYHLRIQVNGRWSFPVHRIRRKVTLSGHKRYRDFWVCTSTYAAWLFNAFLSFPFLLYGICSPGGLRLKRGTL